MASKPTLFDLPAPNPTTRTIALLVKEGGVDALPAAVLKADAARYQEVVCRSALNRVQGMPFSWTLNPYRGCTHGCHYCFARRYQAQLELDSGEEFSSVILVKTNFVEVLGRELNRPAWRREQVALGTATDPYQPIEGHYRLTRGALEALAAARTPVSVVTKGPMAVRDKDVLVEVTKRASCTVCFSVPTVDEDAWRALEPGTAHPLQRLRAVRELCDAGVRAGVLMAPVVPGLTSKPHLLEATVKAIADHGAAFVGANVLHLQDGTRAHFMSVLAREYPQLVERYERLYRGKYAPKSYVSKVRALVDLLQMRYPARRRPAIGSPEPAPSLEDSGPAEAMQEAFDW